MLPKIHVDEPLNNFQLPIVQHGIDGCQRALDVEVGNWSIWGEREKGWRERERRRDGEIGRWGGGKVDLWPLTIPAEVFVEISLNENVSGSLLLQYTPSLQAVDSSSSFIVELDNFY